MIFENKKCLLLLTKIILFENKLKNLIFDKKYK